MKEDLGGFSTGYRKSLLPVFTKGGERHLGKRPIDPIITLIGSYGI
jgi:hypothetical protein